MIKELIQTVILALGTYKLFEILIKWWESIEEILKAILEEE